MAEWSFELWLGRMFRPAAETDGDGVCLEIGDGVGPCGTLSREHTRRLALRLLRLSGHAPGGRLTDAELEAIRQDGARLLARVETSDDPVAREWFAWVARNLGALADAVESPPAPAPGEES